MHRYMYGTLAIIKLKSKLVFVYATMTCGGTSLHILNRIRIAILGECSASHFSCFTPYDKIPSTHWTGDLVSSTTGLDVSDKRHVQLSFAKVLA